MIGLWDLDLELWLIKWLLEFGNVIIKMDLEFWLIKWLLDFGNVIMKIESLELKWFYTLNIFLSLSNFQTHWSCLGYAYQRKFQVSTIFSKCRNLCEYY